MPITKHDPSKRPLPPVLHALAGLALLLGAASCGPPEAKDAAEVLKALPTYAGKRVTIRGKFKSGARCRQEPGKPWQTYCNDCQFCRGPVVLDTGAAIQPEGLDDWPLILGGTWKGQDIRCKGALNAIECFPFKEGKTYIVQGQIEAQHPPKLLVEKIWDVEDQG